MGGTNTFVYASVADSNLVTGYDSIVGFHGRDGRGPLLPGGSPGRHGSAPQRNRPRRHPIVTFASRQRIIRPAFLAFWLYCGP